MIRFLRLLVAVVVTGLAGMPTLSAAAEQTVDSILGVKTAPDARRPRYALARGMFLIASRRLVDPNFSQSVVLLLEYDSKGALGLIVNRPTEVTLTDLLPDVDVLKERSDVVYVGGPVSKNRIVLLMRSDEHPRESGRVFADTYVSSSMETLEHAVALAEEGATFHAYVGYAGWGPGQLDNEVERGDWHITPAEEAIVFDRASEEIWPELIEKNSGHWVRISAERLLAAGSHP